MDLSVGDSLVSGGPVNVTRRRTVSDHDLRMDANQLEDCIRWIEENKYVKIGLQFPDDWLNVADRIAVKIQQRLTTATVYILADCSYGSCCVDEISAAHVSADSIVHFGPACLSPSDRLPVFYIFQNSPLDCQQAAQQLQNIISDRSVNLILIYEVQFAHIAEQLHQTLSCDFPNLLLSKLVIPGNGDGDQTDADFILNGRKVQLKPGTSVDDYAVVYVGEEGRSLTNFLMILNKCKFYRYDPVQGVAKVESDGVNRNLRKRIYAIEKAKTAKLVGLLVGTLGVSGYVSIIERLKQVGKQAGKKTYTIIVGRLNPTKLANFPEIDVFVLIACWEHTLLDSKDFYKPIITPFEFELACNSNRLWTGDYVTDFRQLLPGGRSFVDLPEEAATSQSSDGSLISSEGTISLIHQQAGGEYLMNRSWKGLEPQIGEAEAANVSQGEFGIASRYEREKLDENTT